MDDFLDDSLMDDIMAEQENQNEELENWAIGDLPHEGEVAVDGVESQAAEGYGDQAVDGVESQTAEGYGDQAVDGIESQTAEGYGDHAVDGVESQVYESQETVQQTQNVDIPLELGHEGEVVDSYDVEPSPNADNARRYTLSSTVTTNSFTTDEDDQHDKHRAHKKHTHLASFMEEEEDEEDGKVPKKKGNPLGENFMDFKWKKPNKELAAIRSRAGLWQGGNRNFKDTSVHDFGDMSDGMELYFYVIRAIVGMFFVLTLLSVPLLVISTAGNGGLAMQDATFPATQSLGNIAYNRESDKAPSFCRDQEGDRPCVGVRYIFGLEVGAKYVTYVISSYEALISITMILVSTWLLINVEDKAEEINNEVSTPADFTVYVRNLPKDVSEGALLAHFSMRYALDQTQKKFPIMGYSVFGASLTFGFLFAIVFSVVAGGTLLPLFGALGSLATPIFLLLFTGIFTTLLWLCNFGAAQDRITPGEKWDIMEEKRNKHREEMAEERRQESGSQVAPEPGSPVRKKNKDKDGGGTLSSVCCLCGLCCCCCGSGAETKKLVKSLDQDGLSPDLPRPNPQPVSNCLHNGYPAVLGSWVADLHIVYPNGNVLSAYLKQKSLMNKIQAMRAKIQQFKEDTPYEKGANPTKVQNYEIKLSKLEDKMEKVHEKVASSIKDSRRAADCEGCFLTFNHEESQQRCLEDYRASSSWIGRLFQPTHLKFMWNSEDRNTAEKKHTLTSLRVEQAPEPNDIYWQRLNMTDLNRTFRTIGSNIITLLVLLISFIIALISAKATADASKAIASTTYCNHMPAMWYGQYYNSSTGDLWDTTNTKWVRNATKDMTVCGGKGFYIVNEEFDLVYDHLPQFRPPPSAASTAKVNRPMKSGAPYSGTGVDPNLMCDEVCHDPVANNQYPNRTGCASVSCHDGLTDWQSLGYPCFQGQTFYPPSAVANCYCTQLYWETARQLPSEDSALCKDFFAVLDSSYFYQFLSVMTVVVVNGAALPVIQMLVEFEKHPSVSAEKGALVSKMFSFQFMNTAIITLIVNTAITGTSVGPFALLGVGEGEYGDFNMDWYINVGSALTITMFVQAFSPHASPLAKRYVVNPLKRYLLASSAATQEQLDELYEHQEFQIEARAAYMGVGLMVTMMYSTGLPLLTVFALISFSLSWFMDKWLLIKEYAQPPMYGPSIPKTLVKLLPLGTFVHMAVGIYMLGSNEIVKGPHITSTAEADANAAFADSPILLMITRKLVYLHTMLLFLIFVAYTGLFVLYSLGFLEVAIDEVSHVLGIVYSFFCGTKASKKAARAAKFNHPDYFRPGFCDEYHAKLTKQQERGVGDTHKLAKADRKRGFKLYEQPNGEKMVCKIYREDGSVNGVFRPSGAKKFTWEHINDQAPYTYDIGLIRKYKTALRGIRQNEDLPDPSRRMRLEEREDKDQLYQAVSYVQ